MTSYRSNPVELRSRSVGAERRPGLQRVQVHSIQALLTETAENMRIPDPGYVEERETPVEILSRVPSTSPEHGAGHGIQYHAGRRRYCQGTVVERARQRPGRH